MISVNIAKYSLKLAFLLAFIPLMVIPSLFSFSPLMFFAPFLIIVYYHKNREQSLWFAFLCGLFIDLLSSHHPFILHAFAYTVTTFFLHGQRSHFFSDRVSTLPLMTFFFSFISTFIETFIRMFIEKAAFFTATLVVSDFFLLPICDAAYAFFWFMVPIFMIQILKKTQVTEENENNN